MLSSVLFSWMMCCLFCTCEWLSRICMNMEVFNVCQIEILGMVRNVKSVLCVCVCVCMRMCVHAHVLCTFGIGLMAQWQVILSVRMNWKRVCFGMCAYWFSPFCHVSVKKKLQHGLGSNCSSGFSPVDWSFVVLPLHTGHSLDASHISQS